MPKFTLDGLEVEAPAGKTVLQVALERGIDIPYFCWHPGLSIAANCRMCLVKQTAQGRSGLVPSCAAMVADGLVIETRTPDVLAARKSVLEFLLINHPLDCPQCDCAGECMLQDHSYNHGSDRSRFIEKKVTRHITNFGTLVHYWGSRCIVCTRCTRFCDEVAGTGELAVVNRGDHSEIAIFPGRPLENPLSGNVVDLCPVGALINTDFMYQARVWFTKPTKSVCPSCSRGCNIDVDALQTTVKRFFPRHNPEVNSYWMCDQGRRNYRYLNSAERLGWFLVREQGILREAAPDQAIQRIAESGLAARKNHGESSVAGLGSLWLTNEEIYLFEHLIQFAFGSPWLGFIGLPAGKAWTSKSGFVIDADRNPNRTGARWIVSDEAVERGYEKVLAEMTAGRIRFLYVVSGVPGWEPPKEFLAALEKVEFVVVQDIVQGPLTGRAHVVVPGAAFTEKTGTWVSSQNRVQQVRRAVAGPFDAAPDAELLQRLLKTLGRWSEVFPPEAIFKEIAQEVGPFQGLTYAGIGDQGKVVSSPGGVAARA